MRAGEPPFQREIHHLYSDHHGWLSGWLRKKLGNSFDAADIAHDTFLRLLTSRSSSGFGSEPRALLAHIAKGLLIDHWRHQEVERAYLDAIAHLPEQHVPSPETRLLVLEALQRIDAMLHALPSKTREIFLLAQFDGLGYGEIAQRLDTSLITVKRHMRKAFIACMAAA
ncbi:RNA polymerase sigma-70 factor (ECF subfamily) [Variovorax sp. 54]|nr:RNA polymerase sigma-70 factor (ECF subfamily) [Variovorax sp. 54]